MKPSSFPWIWVTLAAIILFIPGATSRLLLDVLGGVTLLILLVPLLVAGAGFLAWQTIRRRLVPCPSCGTMSFGSDICPACGTALHFGRNEASGAKDFADLDASQVTINVESVDVEPTRESEPRQSS